MKQEIYTSVKVRSLLSYLVLFFVSCCFNLRVDGQATVTQTTDNDFGRGVLNNMIVGNGSISFPSQCGNLSYTWNQNSTSLPIPLKDHRVAYWNGYLILTGGYTGSGYSNAVYIAPVGSIVWSWTSLPALPEGVSAHTMIIANGYIYVIGGLHNGIPSNIIYKTKITLTGIIEPWQTCSVQLPVALWGHTATFVNGSIYVIGGNSQPAEGNALNSVYSAGVNPDGSLTEFSLLTNSLPDARNRHATVADGKYLYVIGGYDNNHLDKSTIYKAEALINGSTTSWQMINNLTVPLSSHSATLFNDVLTVMGGYTNSVAGNESTISYYAHITESPNFLWQQNFGFPFAWADGAAIAVNNRIFTLGGVDNFGVIRNNIYYNSLDNTSNVVQTGQFTSNVFDLVENRQIISFGYTASGLAGYNVYYRSAASGGEWTAWTDAGTSSNIPLSLNQRYFQYMFTFDNAGAANTVSIQDVSIQFSATSISGTLSGTLHWTLAASPYIVSGETYLDYAYLTIDPGVHVLFMNETGLEIGHANIQCNGTNSDKVLFSSMDGLIGNWEGLYFNNYSDDWGTSDFDYTVFENAGYGSRNANIYCYSTNQPTLTNCIIRNSSGSGIRLNNGIITLENCTIQNNQYRGIDAWNNSNFEMDTCTVSNNSWEGLIFNSNCTATITESTVTENGSDGIVINNSSPVITTSQFINNGGSGITVNSSSPQIAYCEISNNGDVGVNANNSTFNLIYSNMNSNNLGGIYMYASYPQISYCDIANNSSFGLGIDNSSPSLSSLNIYGNLSHAIYIYGLNSFPFYYDIHLNNNLTNDIRLAGGDITASGTWRYCDYPWVMTGNIRVQHTLTLQPGLVVKAPSGISLQIGHDNPGGLIAEGTSSNPITFTSLDLTGTWNGITFNYMSNDYWGWGNSSSMKYCIIEHGSGTNVYCESTSQPTFQNCVFRNSDGYGLYLSSSSPQVLNCQIQNNAGIGINLYNSSPNLSNLTITGSSGNAFYINGLQSFPQFSNLQMSGNLTNDIRLAAGDITTTGVWQYCGYPWVMTGITRIGSSATLTIQPGNIVEGVSGASLQIGWCCWTGGNLIAEGTDSNPILFTSADPNGNWNGLNFTYGASCCGGVTSSLKHCIVEHGNANNVYCESTNQPTFESCTIRNSAGNGLYLNSSSPQVTNCQIQNNAGKGLCIVNSSPNISGCQIQNNDGTGIDLWNSSPNLSNLTITGGSSNAFYISGLNSFPQFTNLQMSGNLTNDIRLADGEINTTGTWQNCGYDWVMTGDVSVTNNSTLTIQPGITVRGSSGSDLIMNGWCCWATSRLIAEGTAANPIIFTSLNSATYWNGIYFTDATDGNGVTSSMKYCTVERTLDRNVYCENTNQPTFQNCIFQNSAGIGLYLSNSSPQLTNCQILDNGGKGLYLVNSSPNISVCQIQNNAGTGIDLYNSSPGLSDLTITGGSSDAFFISGLSSFPLFSNLQMSGNLTNDIRLATGDISTTGTWQNCGYDWVMTGDVNVTANSALTIQPGITVRGSSGSNLVLKGWCCWATSRLIAEGTATNPIVFTSLDPTTNWNGIYFTDASDENGVTSSMKYCIIENTLNRNVICDHTNQPTFKNCTFRNSADVGLYLYNSSPTIDSCTFEDNTTVGIYCNYYSNPLITNSLIKNNGSDGIHAGYGCSPTIGNTEGLGNTLYGNDGYEIYNDSWQIINARYNNWNSSDSLYITSRVYDYYDNSSKGIVYIFPYSSNQNFVTYSISGTVNYQNPTPTPIENLSLHLRNSLNTVIATNQTSADGSFLFTGHSSGFYNFTSSTTLPWGGVNSTDALLVMKNFAGLITLSGINLLAGDVNGSNTYNGTDALLIMKRFTGLISSFSVGDWKLLAQNNPGIINDSDITDNIQILCTGDVNGSYTLPGGSKSEEMPEVNLINKGTLVTGTSEVYELPVYVNQEYTIGAISLVLNYPEEYVDISGVTMPDGSQVYYTTQNGELRISWCSLNPLVLNEGDVLLVLQVNGSLLSSGENSLGFTISNESELADGNAQVIQNAMLSIPNIDIITGIDAHQTVSLPYFNIYPNPFTGNPLLIYQLDENANVRISILNLLGQTIAVIDEGNKLRGINNTEIDASKLSGGVYLIKLEATSLSKNYREIKRVVKIEN